MKSINSENDLLKSIMKLIARQFGDKCEIVLHDWSEGYDKSIVAIENGHVSGRKVGDPGSNLGLEVMRGSSDGTSQYNYVTRTKDGKTLRSSSLYLTNDEGEKIGALCINFDISDILSKEDKMRALRFLDEKGALLITKSGTRICKFLGISKFTLYNYLDELRGVGNGNG